MTPRAPCRLALAAAVAAALSACAPRFDPRLAEAPIAGRPWVSREQVGHPLVGRIWDVRAGRYVDEAALAAAAAAADFVALGETHDNPDHHLLQARLVQAIAAAGRRPALAFEMITVDQQAAVDAALAASPRDPDAVARAVDWKGWPDFRWYRPIFAAGLEAGLPIVAANLSRAKLKEVHTKGRDALDEDLRLRLAREEPIPAEVLAQLRTEMGDSHCGHLPESMFDPLVLAQRARDARMAERLLTAGRERGAILITGKGHARTDRGVPYLVAKDAPGRSVLAIAFFEVREDGREPRDYAADYGGKDFPFDVVVFTPGQAREDPCEAMRLHMEKRKAAAARKAAEAPPPATPATPAPAPGAQPAP